MPPTPLPTDAAALRAIADRLESAAARLTALRAVAEAVLAFDGDGLGQQATPQWAALVTLARAAIE